MDERVYDPAGTNQKEPQKGQEQGGEGDVGALGGCGGFLSPRRRAAVGRIVAGTTEAWSLLFLVV